MRAKRRDTYLVYAHQVAVVVNLVEGADDDTQSRYSYSVRDHTDRPEYTSQCTAHPSACDDAEAESAVVRYVTGTSVRE